MAESTRIENLPEGMFSLLDTDLYKLTMQCAILKYMPDVREYSSPSAVTILLLTDLRGHLRFHESDTRHAIQPSGLPLVARADR